MALRVILAGMGLRGRDWAAELQRNDRCELVACVDVDRQTLDTSAGGFGIPENRRHTDLQSALNSHDCDAVVVATSADTHEAACRLAIQQGKALLVEKPFALDTATALSIAETGEAAGVPIVVAQNYRYMRAWRSVRQVIRAGSLGTLQSFACHYHRVPHEMAPSLARLENAVMWGASIHHLDALRHVLGLGITRVSADIFSAPASPVRGASLNAILELDQGVRGTYTASYESSGHEFFERGQEFYARFTGDRATLHMFHRWLFLCEGKKLPRPIRRGGRPVPEEALLLEQLDRALHHGEQPDSSGRDNVQTMALAEACIRSSVERRWVDPAELLR
jgi:predicted dehydrogenase